jgi:Uma2 family endonuclease
MMVDQTVEQTGLMSIAEFVRLYDTEGPFEVIDGEIKVMSPTVAGHGSRAKRIYDAMIIHDPQEAVGSAFFEMPFVLTDTPDWVKGSRVPDLMFFRAERFAQYKAKITDWEDKPFILVPDLVIEVISANDSYTDVDEKVDRYLEDGVQMVWVVDSRRKIVTVRGATVYRKLTINDSLTGGDIIPGFEMPLKAIFE